jgi:hypothetical protein
MMNPISSEGVSITGDGVTFSVPTASASMKALDPRGPGADTPPDAPALVEGAPLYVVVLHDGVEVLYKRVGD